MKIREIIEKNDPEIVVLINGNNPESDTDPRTEEYFHGELKDVPEYLKDCDILRTGWSFKCDCYTISVSYLKKENQR